MGAKLTFKYDREADIRSAASFTIVIAALAHDA